MPKKSYYKKRRKPPTRNAVAKVVKSVLAKTTERKFYTISQTGVSQGVTPTFIHLTAVSQGDTASTRDGNVINGKFLNVKLHMLANASAVVDRFMVLIIKVPDGNLFTDLDDIFDDGVSPDVFTSQYATAKSTLSDRGKFRVVYKKVVLLDNVNRPQWQGDINVKLDHQIVFSGALGSTPVTNHYQMILISEDDTNKASFTYRSRLTYSDS